MTISARRLTAAAIASAVAVPVAAQYPYPQPDPYQQQYPYPQQQYPYGGQANPYPYPNAPYGQGSIGSVIDSLIGNRYNVNDRQAIHRCANAAVLRAQNQYGHQPYGGNYGGNYGNNYPGGYSNVRVTAITDVHPRQAGGVRVRGLISSGAYAYDPRFAAAADLKFRCDIDYRGYVYDVRLEHNDDYHYRRY
jgi:hypothetical protein